MRAIAILMLGMFAITVNDSLFKLYSDSYSLHQLIFMRSTGALLVLLPIFFIKVGKELYQTERFWLHCFRALLLVCGNMIYFSSLAILPIGESTALVFVYPLMITVLAFFLLKENIGIFRWGAIACGVIGTLLIVQPFGAQFQVTYFIPLSAAIFYASFAVMTKILGETERTETLVFYSLLSFFVTSGLVGVFFGSGWASPNDGGAIDFMLRAWQIPNVKDYWFIGTICCSTALITFALTAAYKWGEASMLAPFEYVVLPLSVISGFFVFGDFPNTLALCGMTIIVLAGIVVALRELVKDKIPASNPSGMVGQALDDEEPN